MDLIFFLPKPHFRQFHLKRFQVGSVHRLSGRVAKAKYTGRMTLSHPDAVKGGVEEDEGDMGVGGAGAGGAMPVEPVYRLTSGAFVRCSPPRVLLFWVISNHSYVYSLIKYTPSTTI